MTFTRDGHFEYSEPSATLTAPSAAPEAILILDDDLAGGSVDDDLFLVAEVPPQSKGDDQRPSWSLR